MYFQGFLRTKIAFFHAIKKQKQAFACPHLLVVFENSGFYKKEKNKKTQTRSVYLIEGYAISMEEL